MVLRAPDLCPTVTWFIAPTLLLLVLIAPTRLHATSPAGPPKPTATALVQAARDQVGKTVRYDPAYRALAYPGGDVPIEGGVCTDVVIRAMRAGLAMDLQQLVHDDMVANFARYPKNWGLKKTDKNIDHRRVPNLQTYFARQSWSIPITKVAADYHPGDLVTCTVPPHLPHIMVVSDRKNAAGVPLVLHNIGGGAKEEDRLFDFAITGHYRIAILTAER